MRLCGATGLAKPRWIGRLLRSSGPSIACTPTRGATGQVPTCDGATGRRLSPRHLREGVFGGRKLFLRKRSRGGCWLHEARRRGRLLD